MSRRNPPVAVRGGGSSGDRWAAMLREVAESRGVPVYAEVQAWQDAGGFGVSVEGPGGYLEFEVADRVDGVRFLAPRLEDVSVRQGLGYFAARLRGLTPTEAEDLVLPPRPSLWRRWRDRRR